MTKKGFTLIELMVTISIMLVMTSIVIFNYNKFNESSLLGAFAYDISLTIRQAQVYGIAVREGNNDQASEIDINNFGEDFKSAFGVHFDKNGDVPLVLFADSNTDGVPGQYDPNIDAKLQTYTFQKGIEIANLCIDTNCQFDYLDIIFKRPNPEAIITGVSTRDPGASTLGAARIELQNSGNDLTKSVVVETTGQISVK